MQRRVGRLRVRGRRNKVDQRLVRKRRQLNADGIAGLHLAALEHDAHHAASANQTRRPAFDELRKKSSTKVLDLHAGITQPRQFDQGVTPEAQERAGRQRQEIHIARANVLSQIARAYCEAFAI
jgi:hypothetical protein